MNESQLTRFTASVADAPPAGAAADVIDGEIIEDTLPGMPVPAPRDPSPVQALVGAYADRVRGTASRALLAAIGRTVKRLIETDGIDPALVFAAIEEAAPRGRRDLDAILAAPGISQRWDRRTERERMFSRWQQIATAIDSRNGTFN